MGWSMLEAVGKIGLCNLGRFPQERGTLQFDGISLPRISNEFRCCLISSNLWERFSLPLFSS